MKFFTLLLIFLASVSCGRTAHGEARIFKVVAGDTFSSVSRRLKSDGIIAEERFFRLQAKWEKSSLKRGNYRIPEGLSYGQLLAILASGKSVSIAVTFPEGFTSFDMGRILEENNICSSNDFVAETRKEPYLQRYPIPKNASPSLEGYLFPDTYQFEADSPASAVVQAMLARFDSIIGEVAEARRQDLHNTLTMASIVQKESGGSSEMPLIAGVYRRRLAIGMPMQADPTLIYALILDGDYDGNIRTRHLRPPYPHPYNTYYAKGLPPGPIANPGKAAILATLRPEATSYLYFVGKGNGTHQFSKTLTEHNAAVRKYQLGN